ncbi:hypothetical protein M2311_005702 [Rhizobium leguminosarum]|nr:hypothetical protein [Rhizobium leguminosarum]
MKRYIREGRCSKWVIISWPLGEGQLGDHDE